MSDIQVDVLAALFFIGWPVYHVVAGAVSHSQKDEAFYQHLTLNSSLFPRLRWIFPLTWGLLMCFNGVGAFLFWHAYASGDNDTTFLVALILYTISFLFQCGWSNMFFRRKMLRLTFFITVIVILGAQIGYFVCTILYPEVVSAVASGLVVLWLAFASIMTGIVAFCMPEHHHTRHHRTAAEERLTEEERQLAEYGTYDRGTGGGYEQTRAQATGGFAPVSSNMVNTGSAQLRKGALPTNVQLQLPK